MFEVKFSKVNSHASFSTDFKTIKENRKLSIHPTIYHKPYSIQKTIYNYWYYWHSNWFNWL